MATKVVKFKDNTPHLEEFRKGTLPAIHDYAESLLQFRTKSLKPENKTLKVLAVDPGVTNVALCFIDKEYGTELTSKIEIPDLGSDDKIRYLYLKAIVAHWVWMFRPEVIFKESVALGAEYGVESAGRFQFLVEDVAFQYKVPCYTVPNTVLRSWMECKHGEATKSEMKLQVHKKFGKEFPTEDETDAYAIGETGLAILDGRYEAFKEAKAKAKKGKK